ncbi:MAG TPA: hypothetical protein VMY76_11045 [Gemmatimonadales bacterium]|nr:hypothetical protein [Gemmatimonadales bacterium]
MKPTSVQRFFLPAALLTSLTLPPLASAQYRLPDLVSVARADSLHLAAIAMSRTPGRWGDAARLHRQSAALRAPEDTMGYRCYWESAQLSYGKDDLSSARASMVKAAAQALARGDIVKAADAYADAAWLADQQHKPREVWKLGRQSEVLAVSPLLSREQREAILKRFVHAHDDLAVVARR